MTEGTLTQTDPVALEQGTSRGRPRATMATKLPSAARTQLLDFAWPGLGHAYAGRRRQAVAFALPPLVLVLAVVTALWLDPAAFALNLLAPGFAMLVLALIAVHAAWRVAALVSAWRVGRATGRALPGVGLFMAALLSAVVVFGHVGAGLYVQSFVNAGQRIFVSDLPSGPDPIDGILGGTVTPSPVATPGPTSGSASPAPGSSTTAPTWTPGGTDPVVSRSPGLPPMATPTPLPGDCNGDGVLDGNDILFGDTNGDCVINDSDDHERDGPTPKPDNSPVPTPPPGPVITPPPVDPGGGFGQVPSAGPINVLFVGLDGGQNRDHSLSDSLIVASYFPEHDRLTMISVPRDTGRLPLYIGGTYPNRINSFLSYAAGRPELFPEGPIKALMKELGFVLGTSVPFYAATNLDGLPRAVDAVGGIDVVLNRAIADPTFDLYLEPGPYHLTGETVLPYVRSRHGPNNNDWVRARRQQDVLRALAVKAQDPTVLIRLPEVIDAIAAVVRTNVPREQTDTLLTILRKANDGSAEHIVLSPPAGYAYQLPYSETGGRYMTALIMSAVRDMSRRVFGTYSRY